MTQLTDVFDVPFKEGDRVAVSTTRGIRVGIITKINEYDGTYPKWTFTLEREDGSDLFVKKGRKQTFDYVPGNVWKVDTKRDDMW